jgi:pimeloyl-ACP methyl ester carboxylesterase
MGHLAGRPTRFALLVAAVLLLAGTGSPAVAVPEGPPFPSEEWTAREAANFALTGESASEQLKNPAFVQRFAQQGAANFAEFGTRQVTNPSFVEESNICATWSGPCTGDPFRYPDVDPFYKTATVVPVEFTDRGGARLSGRVWAPKRVPAGVRLPGVVIANGSVGAPETVYWWLAEALVRGGYTVLTYDPRGQGRSDTSTPGGELGSNANLQVFPDDLVDAIDFFRSTPAKHYPHPPIRPLSTPTTPFNPLYAFSDPDRLGIAGHSAGAIAVTLVQGYSDADWPGALDHVNPVKAVVALDNLGLNAGDSGFFNPVPAGVLNSLPVAATLDALLLLADQTARVAPRVPAMGQAGDYFLVPTPLVAPPDPELKKEGFRRWVKAGVPTAQVQIRGGTHYEFSQLPGFPNRSWSIGTAMSQHYAVAWFDRWLKAPKEPGYADADARLLSDGSYRPEMSVYLRNARAFPDRAGTMQRCEDIRAGCKTTAATVTPLGKPPAAAPPQAPSPTGLAATGSPPAMPLLGIVLLSALGAVAVARRLSSRSR